MLRKILVCLVSVALVVLLSSCAIYSVQDYGAQSAKFSNISPGSTLVQVLSELGAPDILYEGPGCDALVYKLREGKTILGPVFSTANRQDFVVVVDKNGKVIAKNVVKRGEGMTVLGPIGTCPIAVDGGGMLGGGGKGALLSGPDNYRAGK
jgi:hypothetical protein